MNNKQIVQFGVHDEATIKQIERSASHEAVAGATLCADGHKGYAVPIGGVLAYEDHISPSGVGFDIACGNKAVLTDADAAEVKANIKTIMDDVWKAISFGMGLNNSEHVETEMLRDETWKLTPM